MPYLRPDGKSQVTVEYVGGKPKRAHACILGYIGTEDKDKDMAHNLLVFGIFWTFFIAFFAVIALSSL